MAIQTDKVSTRLLTEKNTTVNSKTASLRGRYVGGFNDGKKNGQGTATFANGDKYVGEYKDGKFNGEGTYTYDNGNSKYVGEFKDGEFNGQGTITYDHGGKFVGEFKDGKLDGQGTNTLPNGEKYFGGFRDNKFNGEGTYTYSDGSKYVGGYKDGKYDGQGTIFRADGSIKWSGIWARLGTRVDQETITMEKRGGVYIVPVRFNDVITLHAIVDSGASDVSVPADIVLTLMRTKTVTQDDFLGKQTYVLADGSNVPSQQFRIRSLKVGNKIIENVVASMRRWKVQFFSDKAF
jgi:hypothetical protein